MHPAARNRRDHLAFPFIHRSFGRLFHSKVRLMNSRLSENTIVLSNSHV